jgi:HAD superfamily hydrolase (TIGR01509 family)
MAKPVILLDDGGVLNDNAVRGPQWQRLIGEFFAPKLGGSPEAWAEANRLVIDAMLAPGAWANLLTTATDYDDFERRYYSAWLGGMCERVGAPRPPGDECLALGRAAEAEIVPRVRSAYPGAVEAVRALRAAGYELHTASGTSSRALGLYLEGMGIKADFGRLYGPDLAGAMKNGPRFYANILAQLGLPPQEALFVDDSTRALEWAAQCGARTVRVGARDERDAGAQIGSLAELPGWLSRQRG